MFDNNVVLVAPRPRKASSMTASQRQVARIVSPALDTSARKSSAGPEEAMEKEVSPPSGRTSSSPRLNLSSDALEEFLSILRPSFLAPSSPTFRRIGPGSIPTLSYERPQPLRPREGIHNKRSSVGSLPSNEGDSTVGHTSPSPVVDYSASDGEYFGGKLWRIPGLLESPISRSHTQNPFYRHPSYDTALQNVIAAHVSPAYLPLPPSPSPVQSNLSPCLIAPSSTNEEIKA